LPNRAVFRILCGMHEDFLRRLTAALYRVTDRLEDREPLKWTLRESALELERMYFQNPEFLSLKREEERSRRMIMLVREVVHLLELVSSLSYVSRINFDVLLREYARFEGFLFQKEETPPMLEGASEDGLQEFTFRQRKIIEFLAPLRNSSVSELVKCFDGQISEKTLQRDLNDLIVRGKVRADGERRWRKYSLVDK